LEREEMPPIEFTKMLDELDFPENLKIRIDELVQLKATVDESYLHSGESELFAFMKTCTQRAEIEAAALPGKKSQMSDLDAFFRKTLG
jgi:predicted nucleotidyltransferase